MDGIKSTSFKHGQDPVHVVLVQTAAPLVKRDLQQLAAVSSSLMVSSSVRDLGVILDGELSFDEHITKLTQACYFHLRRLRTIRRSLSLAALKTLVHSFVCNRIDFCNSAFLVLVRLLLIVSNPS